MMKGIEHGEIGKPVFVWKGSRYSPPTVDVTFICRDYPDVEIKTNSGSIVIPYDALYDLVTDQLRQKLEYQMQGLSPEEMIKRIVK